MLEDVVGEQLGPLGGCRHLPGGHIHALPVGGGCGVGLQLQTHASMILEALSGDSSNIASQTGHLSAGLKALLDMLRARLSSQDQTWAGVRQAKCLG